MPDIDNPQPHVQAPPARKSLQRRLRNVAIGLGVLVATSAAGLWLLGRESTLISATDYLTTRLNGRLHVGDVRGSLLGKIRVRDVRFEDAFGKLAISDAHLEWRPLRLLIGQIAVDEVAAGHVALDLAKTEDEPRVPPQSLRSPISFAVVDFKIGTFALTQQGTTHEIRGIRAAFSGNRRNLKAELKSLASAWGNLKGQVKLGADSPFPLQGDIAFAAPNPADYAATVRLGGTLLNAEAALEARARTARAVAKVGYAPYATQPLTRLELSARDIDPKDWQPSGPGGKFSAEAQLAAGPDRALNGHFLVVNAAPGTIDENRIPFTRASAVLRGDLKHLAFDELKIDLATAGQFAGKGGWRNGELSAALNTGNFNLRGIQKRLNATRLGGQLALGGNGAQQRVRLALKQAPYQFRFAGALQNGVARIDEAYARAGDAHVTTRGRVLLNANKAFSVDGRLANFDPAKFGKYPTARINSRFELKGQLAPVMQLAANLNMSNSRLFGMPASANGTFRSRRVDRPDVAMDFSIRVGDTRASAKGTLQDLANMGALDLQLSLAGASLAELYRIVGVPLPPTPPYRINGRLVHREQLWELRKFAGAVGGSDLSGDFLVDRGRSPQFMKAELTSNRLALADLAGFVGAEKTPTGEVTTRNPSRVLPDSPYSLEKLKAADADVRFTGKRILTERLPLDNMSTHLIVKNGVLTLAPLNFGVAGGNLVSTITLDGRGSVIASSADIRVQALQLEQLMPRLKASQASVGEMDGRVRLTARGNSVAAMLGSANGNTSVVVGEGEVSDLLLRLSNLDVANAILVLMRGDRNIPLRCMVADFQFENGLMHPRQFIFDTAHTTLTAEGRVNFKDERLDLRLVAKPKGRSLVSLRGPIVVSGTFADPSVRPDVKQLALRGAAATALGIVATPLAAIIPFVQLGGAPDVQCGPLLQNARRAIGRPRPAHVAGR